MKAFAGIVRKVARELFPPHVDVGPDPGAAVWVRESTADIVEIFVVDRSKGEPFYGVAAVHGRLLRSPQLEDAVRHELRHLAEEMGYTTLKSSKESE